MPAPTYVGGQPATFVCVHAITAKEARTPVRFAYSANPDDHLRDNFQDHHWLRLGVAARYWVADRSLAHRIVAECRRLSEGALVRGAWYDLNVDAAEAVIVQAAKSLSIPVLSDDQHESLRLSSAQRGDLLARRAGVFR